MGRVIRTVVILLVAVALGYGIWWKLQDNKEQMEAEVRLTTEQNRFVPVTVAVVGREAFAQRFSINGAFRPSQETVVVPTVNGQITKLNIRNGSYVHEGAVMIEVDSEYTENELKAAELKLKNARRNLERMENLIGEGGVTQRQYEEVQTEVESGEIQLESLRKRLQDSYIKAPISGTISPLPQRPMPVEGGFVGQGNPLFQIVNVQRIVLEVLLTAEQVIRIDKGLEVPVTADVYPGRKFTGRVVSIGIKTDMFSKRYPVEIELSNRQDAFIRGGMSGKAHFDLGVLAPVLAVPREAFIGSPRDGALFVLQDSTAVRRTVATGAVYGDRVEILDGLQAGERVVLSGQINLEDGVRVQVLETEELKNRGMPAGQPAGKTEKR